MISFTLDTNCLIDLEEGRAGAEAVREWVEAHLNGSADVAVTTVTASERQKDGGFLESYADFQDRLVGLGLSNLTQVQPIAHWNISFYDHGYVADQRMVDSEAAIHAVLSPLALDGVDCDPEAWLRAPNLYGDLTVTDISEEWDELQCADQKHFLGAELQKENSRRSAAEVTGLLSAQRMLNTLARAQGWEISH